MVDQDEIMANEKLENPLSSCLCTISSNFYSIQFTIIAFFPKLERNSVDTAKLSRYSFSSAHTGRMSCRYQVTIEKEAFFTVRQCLVNTYGTHVCIRRALKVSGDVLHA